MANGIAHSSIRMEHRFPAMGGEFHLLCFPQNFLSKDSVKDLFQKAQNEVNRIEQKFTDFHDGPFNEINRMAGIKPVVVDDEIFDLINRSLAISKESKGLFDISYASIGHLWRNAVSRGKTLSSSEREEAKRFIDYRMIKVNEKKSSIFLPHKEMKVGLGGIGKGYAVDRVFDLLQKEGLYNFYVNGSGDIRVHSHYDAPRPWKIGIRNPFSEDATKSIGAIQIRSGSVASSGGHVKNNPNHPDDHHILNPCSGLSVSDLIATTVLANEAVVADTTATILMNFSAKEAITYLEKRSLVGLVVDRSGKTHLSPKALDLFGR